MKKTFIGLALVLLAVIGALRWLNTRPLPAPTPVAATAPGIQSAPLNNEPPEPEQPGKVTPPVQRPRLLPSKLEVELTGLNRIEGRKHAFLSTGAPDGTVRHYRLAEGEEQGPLKIVGISLQHNSAEVLVEKEYRRLTLGSGKDPAQIDVPRGVLEKRRFDAAHQNIGNRDAREYERWQQQQAQMAAAGQ